MRKLLRLPVVVFVGVAAAGLAAPLGAQAKKAAPSATQRQAVGSALTKSTVGAQPDIAVASLTIELLSTTKGQPGVEFPADRLKITGIVKDIGGVKPPAGFTVKLLKGLSQVVAKVAVPVPSARGQVWSLVHEDTFLHDKAPIYQIVVEAGFSEGSTANNKLDIGLSDQTLHTKGKQSTSDPSIGGIQVPGSVVIFF